MSYNGWSNYETWCVNLWIENDQGMYSFAQDQAAEAWEAAADESTTDRKVVATRQVADALKDTFENDMPNVSGVWADLINAAMGEVDWDEIAQPYVDEVESNAGSEEEE
jgi:hypothetical protein